MKRGRGLALLLLFLAAGCTHPATEGTGDLAVTLVTEPNPPRVGDNLLTARVASRDGKAGSVSGIQFHYYPFVQRDKDSLASPDEVVRVVEGAAAGGTYRAKATFDKPGPWKVTLKIARSDAPEAIMTFTFNVRA